MATAKKTTRKTRKKDDAPEKVYLKHKTTGRIFEYTEELAKSGNMEVATAQEVKRAGL